MARHGRPVNVRVHRAAPADGVAGKEQEAAEAGDLVELLLSVVAADLNEAGGKETVELVEKAGGEALFVKADRQETLVVVRLSDFIELVRKAK